MRFQFELLAGSENTTPNPTTIPGKTRIIATVYNYNLLFQIKT